MPWMFKPFTSIINQFAKDSVVSQMLLNKNPPNFTISRRIMFKGNLQNKFDLKCSCEVVTVDNLIKLTSSHFSTFTRDVYVFASLSGKIFSIWLSNSSSSCRFQSSREEKKWLKVVEWKNLQYKMLRLPGAALIGDFVLSFLDFLFGVCWGDSSSPSSCDSIALLFKAVHKWSMRQLLYW